MQKVRPNKFKWRGVFSPIRYNGQEKRCISRLQTQGIRGLYIYLSNSCFLIRNWTRCTLSKGLVFVAIFNIILKIITQLLLLLRNLRQWRNLKNILFGVQFSLWSWTTAFFVLFFFLVSSVDCVNINLIHKHDHKKAYINFSGFLLSFFFWKNIISTQCLDFLLNKIKLLIIRNTLIGVW